MEAGLRLCDQVRPGPLPSDVLEFRLEGEAELIIRLGLFMANTEYIIAHLAYVCVL